MGPRAGAGPGGIVQLPDGIFKAAEFPQTAGGTRHSAEGHESSDPPRNRPCPGRPSWIERIQEKTRKEGKWTNPIKREKSSRKQQERQKRQRENKVRKKKEVREKEKREKRKKKYKVQQK